MQNFKIIGLVTAIAGTAWVAITYCGGSACIANCVPLIAVWCYTKRQSETKKTSREPLVEEIELEDIPTTV